MSSQLSQIDQAARQLAKARSVPEVNELRDKAQAILDYLKQQKGNEDEVIAAAAFKVRCERRMGELLDTVHPGNPQLSHDGTIGKLPDGVTRNDSSRWQSIARIPADEFQRHLDDITGKRRVATTAYFLRLARLYPAPTNGEPDEDEESEAEEDEAPAADWRIVQGDCRAHLGITERPALIFADPPYNVGVDYGDGEDADRLPDEDFVQFCSEWLAVCHARLTDDGSLWVLIGDEYAAEMALLLNDHDFHRRAWVKWYETFGVCNSSWSNFNRTSRHLFYCVKDPHRFAWNPGAVMRSSDRQTKYNDARADLTGKVWDDVWEIPRLVGTGGERVPGFPTQLPLDLLRPIIGCSSNHGDLVLDPFCGSASTGVAAIEAGRRFLGIEKQQRFIDLATLRLKGIRREQG